MTSARFPQSHEGKLIDRRDSNPCKEGCPGKKMRVGRSGVRVPVPEKESSHEIFVKVTLFDHLVVEFVHYISLSCMMYQLYHCIIVSYVRGRRTPESKKILFR